MRRYRERVTRIIAGAARGIRLDVPGAGTRPTSDRVRESLFGALETAGFIDGARVLDLYAGSGALGLEALSRGAASLDAVERSRPAAAVIRRNLGRVRSAIDSDIAPSVRIHDVAVRNFLRRATGAFDLVFTDPPYDIDDDVLDGDLALLAPLLAPGAVVVIERARNASRPEIATAGLELLRERTYGDTALWWVQPIQPPAESQSR